MIRYFEFSKEVHLKYSVEGFGVLKNWQVYKVVQDGKPAGLFYYHKEICYFEYEDREMGLKISRPGFKNIQADIIDRRTEQRIGAIELRTQVTFDPTIGWIQLGDTIYKAERQRGEKPNVIWSNDWGYYQFCISNTRQDAIYGLQTSMSATSPFKGGKIQFLGNDLLLVFAGLFLVEEALQQIAESATR